MNFFRALVDDVCGVIKKIAQTREDLCVQPALNISDRLLRRRVVFLCGGGQKFHAVLPIIARIAVKQSDLHARPEVKPGGFFKMSKPLFGLPVLIIQLADLIFRRNAAVFRRTHEVRQLHIRHPFVGLHGELILCIGMIFVRSHAQIFHFVARLFGKFSVAVALVNQIHRRGTPFVGGNFP